MSDPAIDLETVFRRNHPTAVTGAIQVDTVADDTQVTLSFGADDGVSYTLLTPADAQAVATALTQAAARAEAADSVDESTDE
jgi:hypothetical protein